MDLSGFDEPQESPKRRPRPLRSASSDDAIPVGSLLAPGLVEALRAAERRHKRELRAFLKGGGPCVAGADPPDAPGAPAALGLDNAARPEPRVPPCVREVSAWLVAGELGCAPPAAAPHTRLRGRRKPG